MTPFDRADMHGLAVALDGCVGLIEAAVDLIVLYRVDEVLPRVAKQVEVISRMADVTADAMPRLRSMKDLTAYWVEVNRLENRANKAYRRMLAELFNTPGADPITVMKHKDIIDALEAAANGFEEVARQGRGDLRPGVLTGWTGCPSRSSSCWRWASRTRTASTTRRTRSPPRSRRGR